MKQKILTAMAVLALLLMPVLQLGCSGGGGAQAATDEPTQQASHDPAAAEETVDDEKKEEAVPVEVAELGTGPIESVLRFSSNLEAESQVKVFSQAKRLVTELLVEEGDHVDAGQLLIRLQDDEQRSALAKAKSELEQSEREYQRKLRLHEQDLIAEQEFNDSTYDYEQLKIALADAERELSYTEVRAPIQGTVTARMVNLGDQVQINQHLFDIVDFDSIVARIFVPERHMTELRRGLTARLSSQATGDRSYVGAVNRIAPIVDPRSGTLKVTVDVGGQPGLRPGMYVDVDLITETRAEALLVPKRALVYDNDQMFVFRLSGDDAEKRVERIFIEPRLTDKHNVEPAAGLAVGDRVVIAGQAGLKDGALVELPEDRDQSDGETARTVDRASL